MNVLNWSAGGDKSTDRNNKGGVVRRPNINNSDTLYSLDIVPAPPGSLAFIPLLSEWFGV